MSSVPCIAAAAAIGWVVGWHALPSVACACERRALRRAFAGACPGSGAGPGAHAAPARGKGGILPAERLLCAVLLAAWLALLWLGGLPIAAVAGLAVAGCGLIVAVRCDLRVRLIPREACAVVGAGGLGAQLAVGGAARAATGAAWAVAVALVCATACRLFASKGRDALGGGDARCMAALCAASGPVAPYGLAASCLAAALFGLAAAAAGRITLKDGIPFAPFFLPWLVLAALGAAAC